MADHHWMICHKLDPGCIRWAGTELNLDNSEKSEYYPQNRLKFPYVMEALQFIACPME
jgi:hypothetical protein